MAAALWSGDSAVTSTIVVQLGPERRVGPEGADREGPLLEDAEHLLADEAGGSDDADINAHDCDSWLGDVRSGYRPVRRELQAITRSGARTRRAGPARPARRRPRARRTRCGSSSWRS